MERSRNIYTQPMGERLRRATRFIFDRFTDDPTERRWKPSPQRDVGKSAVQALAVQQLIADMQVERTDVAQLRNTVRYDAPGSPQ